MKVVFAWTRISGYMAACWRELAVRPGMDVHVLAESTRSGSDQIGFTESLLGGISHELLSADDLTNAGVLAGKIAEQRPDVVVLCGWANRAHRALPGESRFAATRFILTMDTPLKGTWRQAVGRCMLGRFLRRMSGVAVAGERAWQYARYLGFAESQILRGVYGYDQALFNDGVLAQRVSCGWPRRFLYVGRYVQEKGLDVLVDAYRAYRSRVQEPWPLTCCGKGPLAAQLRGIEGVTDAGFVQPVDQPRVYRDHGALLLPSRYEPWGVVVAEAMACGLPVICSEACGAAVELVRPWHNGLLVPTGSSKALAEALEVCADTNRLQDWGSRAAGVAPAFAAEAWARRWERFLASGATV